MKPVYTKVYKSLYKKTYLIEDIQCFVVGYGI